MNTKSTLDSRL